MQTQGQAEAGKGVFKRVEKKLTLHDAQSSGPSRLFSFPTPLKQSVLAAAAFHCCLSPAPLSTNSAASRGQQANCGPGCCAAQCGALPMCMPPARILALQAGEEGMVGRYAPFSALHANKPPERPWCWEWPSV